MIEIVLENLKLISFAVALLGLSMFSNSCFGIWYNVKILQKIFSIKKIISSLVKFLVFTLGLTSLSILVTLLPSYAKYSGVDLPDDFYTTASIVIIIAIFIKTIVKYTKQSFEKLNNILDGSGK